MDVKQDLYKIFFLKKKKKASTVGFGSVHQTGVDSESDQLIPEIFNLIIRLKVPEKRGRKRNFLKENLSVAK